MQKLSCPVWPGLIIAEDVEVEHTLKVSCDDSLSEVNRGITRDSDFVKFQPLRLGSSYHQKSGAVETGVKCNEDQSQQKRRHELAGERRNSSAVTTSLIVAEDVELRYTPTVIHGA